MCWKRDVRSPPPQTHAPTTRKKTLLHGRLAVAGARARSAREQWGVCPNRAPKKKETVPQPRSSLGTGGPPPPGRSAHCHGPWRPGERVRWPGDRFFVSSAPIHPSPSSHLEPVHAQQPRQDALLEAGAQHDGVVGLVHGGGVCVWRRGARQRRETKKRRVSVIANFRTRPLSRLSPPAPHTRTHAHAHTHAQPCLRPALPPPALPAALSSPAPRVATTTPTTASWRPPPLPAP